MLHSDRELLLAYAHITSLGKLSWKLHELLDSWIFNDLWISLQLEVQLTHCQTATTYYAVRCGNKTKNRIRVAKKPKACLVKCTGLISAPAGYSMFRHFSCLSIYLFIYCGCETKKEKGILDRFYLFCLFFVPTVIQLSGKGSNLSTKFGLIFLGTKRQ